MPEKKSLFQALPKYIHHLNGFLTEKEQFTFSATSKLFKPVRTQIMVKKLLQSVMHGDQKTAEKLVRLCPELLMMECTGTDFSGRTFATTAFRYALWAWDIKYMCNMLLDCLPNNERGDNIKQHLLEQYQTHMKEGLRYQLKGETHHDFHFDFSPIFNALKYYVDHYDGWWASKEYDAPAECWSKQIGCAQRYFPAYVAQNYTRTRSNDDKNFFRTLSVTQEKRGAVSSEKQVHWFEPPSSTSGLGIDYGICMNNPDNHNYNFRYKMFCARSCGLEYNSYWGFYSHSKGFASEELTVLTRLQQTSQEALIMLHDRLNPQPIKSVSCCVIS